MVEILLLLLFLGMQHRVVLTTTPFGLPLNFETLPEKLKDAGTVLCIAGYKDRI